MSPVPVQEILGPPPAGSDLRTKILWFAADAVATGIVYQLFDYGQEIQPAASSEGDPDATVWMHVQVVWEDTVSAAPADDQVFTLDILNWTGGQPDSTWTTQDFDLCSANIATFCNAILGAVASRMRAKEIRYYRRSYLPMSEAKHFTDAGGPAHIHALGLTPPAGASGAPQITTTVTEVTPSRKHWGRVYLPSLSSGLIATTGRFTTTFVDQTATAFDTMLTANASIGYRHVVPTTSSGGIYDPTVAGDWTTVKAHTLQQVNGCRVDDVVDVHRRRRSKQALYRKIIPTP